MRKSQRHPSVILFLFFLTVLAASCSRAVRPDFIEAKISDDQQSIEVIEGGNLIFQPRFGDPAVSPDHKTVAFISSWPDSPAMRMRAVLVEVGKPAGLPTILYHLSKQQVDRGDGISEISYSPESEYVAVHFFRGSDSLPTDSIMPRNETLVANVKSKSTSSLSEMVRKAIDAQFPANDRYHRSMKDRPNCTYGPKWNSDGSLSFIWDYAGPEFSKPIYRGTYNPQSETVTLDFGKS